MPITYFEIVEMHVSDRVLHQFEFTQHIHDVVDQLARIDSSNKHQCEWRQELNVYISQWDDQANQLQIQRHPIALVAELYELDLGITHRWIIQRVDPLVT